MRYFGFSTGSLAYSDFKKALSILKNKNVNAIELSALRDHELKDLVKHINSLNLGKYKFKSFHAPSKFETLSEEEVIQLLEKPYNLGFYIVIHPDAIVNFDLWKRFGDKLCIENMDKRKAIGRNVEELDYLFSKLPNASLCFDVGHCRQVDPTMYEASRILKKFGNKLKYIHISEVNSFSRHESMSIEAVKSFYKVSSLIPDSIGVIIESVVSEDRIDLEVMLAKLSLDEWDSNIEETKKGILDFLKAPLKIFKSKEVEKYSTIECRVYFKDHISWKIVDNSSPWMCVFNNEEIRCNVKNTNPVKIRNYISHNIYEPMKFTVEINNSIGIVEGMSFGIEKENVKGMGVVTSISR